MNFFQSRTTAVVAGAAVLAFATGSVAVANQDARGPEDGQGPASAPGLQGLKGQDGVSGAYTAKPTSQIVTIQPGQAGTATATCVDGRSAIAGGYEVEGARGAGRADISVLRDQPAGTYEGGMFDSWQVEVYNGSTNAVTLQPAVVCAYAN